jgi:glycosyltransferase involved in cell wall biosynthesis
MRIIQFASGDLWGGAEACVLELCSGLRHAGIEVAAVLLNPGELADRLHAAGVSTQVISEVRLDPIRIALQLRSSIAAFGPDIVHSHRMKEHVVATVSRALCLGHRPRLVKTIHGADEHSTAPPWSRRNVARMADQFADRFFDARVAVSEELAGRLQASSPQTRFTMIHNGIRHVDSAAPPQSASGHRIVGFAGRLVPIKRVDLVLDTAHRLMQRSGRDIRFEIAGDGPLRAALAAQAKALNLSGTVEFLGFVPDIWSALLRWDALILPSDHEGLPMTCLEALAAGVPIVARAVGGLGELVRGPRQGVLVPTADPEDLADAVLAVLHNAHVEHGKQSRLPAEFTSEAMCERYIGLYREILSKY